MPTDVRQAFNAYIFCRNLSKTWNSGIKSLVKREFCAGHGREPEIRFGTM